MLVENTETLTKPTDLEPVRYLSVLTTATTRVQTQLIRKHESFLREYWPNPTEVDTPKYFADLSAAAWLIAPTPGNDYPYHLSYKALATSITVATAGTWITQHAPDLLFFACMVEAYVFMKNMEQSQIWEARYQSLLNQIKAQEIIGSRTDERIKGDK